MSNHLYPMPVLTRQRFQILEFCGKHKSTPKLRLAIFRSKLLVVLPPPGILFIIACIFLLAFEPRTNFIAFTNVAINETSFAALGCYVLAWDYVSIVKDEPESSESTTLQASHPKEQRKSTRASKLSTGTGTLDVSMQPRGGQQTLSHQLGLAV